MYEYHTVKLGLSDLWNLDICVSKELPEELNHRIITATIDADIEAAYAGYLRLKLKIARGILSCGDDPLEEVELNLSLAELWTMVHSVLQTDFQNARDVLLQAWAGLLELTTLDLEEEPEISFQDAIISVKRLFAKSPTSNEGGEVNV